MNQSTPRWVHKAPYIERGKNYLAPQRRRAGIPSTGTGHRTPGNGFSPTHRPPLVFMIFHNDIPSTLVTSSKMRVVHIYSICTHVRVCIHLFITIPPKHKGTCQHRSPRVRRSARPRSSALPLGHASDDGPAANAKGRVHTTSTLGKSKGWRLTYPSIIPLWSL